MIRKAIKTCAIGLATWLPFCVLWVLFVLSITHERLPAILLGSLISMGSAGLLGIVVWHLCRRFPWPLRFSLKFYLLQIIFALLYAAAWIAAVYALEWLRRGTAIATLYSW